MSEKNVEIERRRFEAWQRNDFDSWVCLHDADARDDR
jgi:hypothetical protein